MVYTFNFVDRQILAILLPAIKAEFLVDDWVLGFLVGTSFAIFYATLGIPIALLADRWNRRNMVIFAISLSVGLGLQLVPTAVQYLPGTLKILMTSGLLPAAALAIVLNLVLPEELSDEATEEVSGGMAGHGDD